MDLPMPPLRLLTRMEMGCMTECVGTHGGRLQQIGKVQQGVTTSGGLYQTRSGLRTWSRAAAIPMTRLRLRHLHG